MTDSNTKLMIVALHKLPFDESGFARDLALIADHETEMKAALSAQFRENWDNAWLVVIEFSGPPDAIDFGAFDHDDQAVWEEKVLESDSSTTRAGFYLHYVDPSGYLRYGDQKLAFPEPTAAPNELIEAMPYCSPD